MQSSVQRMAWRLVVTLLFAFCVFGTSDSASAPQERGYGLQEYRPHAPQASQSTRQQGYQRFHANDSYIGRPVLCSQQEKLCFEYNMLYQKDFGCVDLRFRNAHFKSGHLVPDSQNELYEGCDGYVMAYDDRCYRKEMVRDVICGCAAEPSRHFVNGLECRCAPPVPIQVDQPKEVGQCRISDLRFPETDVSRFFKNPYKHIQGFTDTLEPFAPRRTPPLNCSSPQLKCFAQGKVWVREGGACFPLLERGPCPPEHVVALDVQAALDGHVETTCAHARGGCMPGFVRMVFDGLCHREEEPKLLARGTVVRNQFGSHVVLSNIVLSVKFTPAKEGDVEKNVPQTCHVEALVELGSGGYVTGGQFVKSKRYEVEDKPPIPE